MLLLACLGLSYAAPVEASTLRLLDPDQLQQASALIVEGRVVQQEVRLLDGWPMTVSTLRVDRCNAAACPSEVEVVQAGGEIGEIGLWVSGVHPLSSERDLVLFLHEHKGQLRPVGMGQGVFEEHEVNGVKYFVRDLRGAAFTSPSGVQSGRVFALNEREFARYLSHSPLK